LLLENQLVGILDLVEISLRDPVADLLHILRCVLYGGLLLMYALAEAVRVLV
jgi:hypothetical protein